jgi:hypothetical protein
VRLSSGKQGFAPGDMGHKQVYGDTYWDTYSPVVSWSTVRLVLILSLILQWHARSIDFIMAYPQADVKTDIYMQLPKGTSLADDKFNDKNQLLKLRKNLYGLKDAGRTWYECITSGLKQRGFQQSNIDPCLFTKDSVILILYVDDAVLFSPYQSAIDKTIKSLQNEFDLTDEGSLQDYLGVRIIRNGNQVEMVQPRMIARCLDIRGCQILYMRKIYCQK